MAASHTRAIGGLGTIFSAGHEDFTRLRRSSLKLGKGHNQNWPPSLDSYRVGAKFVGSTASGSLCAYPRLRAPTEPGCFTAAWEPVVASGT